jgi:hypothetical protein
MSVRCKLLRERYFEKYQLRETTGSLVSRSKVLAERVVIAQLNNFLALCGTYMVFAMFIRAYHWVDSAHILTLFFKDRFNYVSPFVPRLCFPHSISSSFYPIHWWKVQNDDFHSVLFFILLFNIRVSFTQYDIGLSILKCTWAVWMHSAKAFVDTTELFICSYEAVESIS